MAEGIRLALPQKEFAGSKGDAGEGLKHLGRSAVDLHSPLPVKASEAAGRGVEEGVVAAGRTRPVGVAEDEATR